MTACCIELEQGALCCLISVRPLLFFNRKTENPDRNPSAATFLRFFCVGFCGGAADYFRGDPRAPLWVREVRDEQPKNVHGKYGICHCHQCGFN